MVYGHRSAVRARCASVAAARALCGRFAAGFFEPVGEHGFGVIGSPLVGQHLVETRIVAVQSQEQLTQVGPGLDTVTLGTCLTRRCSWQAITFFPWAFTTGNKATNLPA